MLASVVLLGWSLKTLPLGTAYAVWTGIGAVGTAILGMLLFGESPLQGEDQCEHMFDHRCRGIGGDIADGDSVFCGGIQVNVVGAGGGDADQL